MDAPARDPPRLPRRKEGAGTAAGSAPKLRLARGGGRVFRLEKGYFRSGRQWLWAKSEGRLSVRRMSSGARELKVAGSVAGAVAAPPAIDFPAGDRAPNVMVGSGVGI